jgi:cell pole-organizing protein PopZ
MEEILSSIKRIIAEDSDAPAPRKPRAAPEPEAEAEADVLELTDTIGEPEAFQALPEYHPDPEPEPEHDTIAAEEAPAIASRPTAPFVRSAHPAPAPEMEAETLLSATSEAATRHALAALSRMVVKPEDPAADNTLEGLVRDMLRPMLKEWLDAHLPGIVQDTVDREVARIAGRGI